MYFELFSHPDRFKYRTEIFTAATCFLILCTALTYLPPFLLTYYTGDFWVKESIYTEQLRLSNRIKYMIIADTGYLNNRFFLSSYLTLNRNFQDTLITGLINETSSDVDGDGILDQFRVSFDLMFPTSTTQVRSMNIWLMFQCELREKQHINMESMALVNFIPQTSLTAGSNLNITIYGQLKFDQREPIQSSGNDSMYDTPIISGDNSFIPDTTSILNGYFARKYYTSLETQYTWVTPRLTTSSNIITVNVIVNVGRQSIRFVPGFWENFKWGWIQYICVLFPFMIVFDRLKLYVFSNQLVQTLVPLTPHRHKA